jgi:rhodanese-related sulfurtransferase
MWEPPLCGDRRMKFRATQSGHKGPPTYIWRFRLMLPPFATATDRRYNCSAMNSTATIDPGITMRELLEQFPGAQRALFRRYHIGGCSSCGFSPEETLAGVCARNENLDLDEVTEHILASDTADRAMQIEPRDLTERLKTGERVHLLDIRTREEFDSVKLPGAHLFTQEFMQEILANWARADLLVIYDHQGTRSMDAAAYFQGHGFEKIRSLRGGIDAWSVEIDPKLARYHLE